MKEIFVNLICVIEQLSIPNTKLKLIPKRFVLDRLHCIGNY